MLSAARSQALPCRQSPGGVGCLPHLNQVTASTAQRYGEAAEQFMESLNELEIVCIGAQAAWRRRSMDNGAAASAAFEGLAPKVLI